MAYNLRHGLLMNPAFTLMSNVNDVLELLHNVFEMILSQKPWRNK